MSEVAQSCLTLCNPMDCSPSGSSVHGIFQARLLEWGAISLSRGSSQPRDQTRFSHIVGRSFYRLSHQGRARMLRCEFEFLGCKHSCAAIHSGLELSGFLSSPAQPWIPTRHPTLGEQGAISSSHGVVHKHIY